MLVLILDRNGLENRRVPDHQICICPHLQAALPGIKPKDPGGGFAEQGAHLAGGNLAGSHPQAVDQLGPVLDAGQAVGDQGEVLPADGLLGQGKGAMVGGNDLNFPLLQGLPQGILIRLGPDGGLHTNLPPSKPGRR